MWRDDISIGSGAFDQGGGGASGSDTVWHGMKDLARVAAALFFVLVFAFTIGAATRAVRRAPARAAVVATSHGDIVRSVPIPTCESESARLDVDNLPCWRQIGPGPR